MGSRGLRRLRIRSYYRKYVATEKSTRRRYTSATTQVHSDFDGHFLDTCQAPATPATSSRPTFNEARPWRPCHMRTSVPS